jgi:hypothetical protein
MIILSPGQTGTFEFIFSQNNTFYDPTDGATPSDVLVSVYRGDAGSGSVIDGPYSYLFQDATPSGNYIEKTVDNTVYYGNFGDTPGQNISSVNATKFSFYYSIPENLFPGNYSVVATTYANASVIQYIAQFQVPQSTALISSQYASGQRDITQSFVPAYERLDQYKTNSVLLIGHADGITLNNIIRISSIQEAIDLLKANSDSPLLRGIFDAYAAGARDIYICAAAPMSEYIEGVTTRNTAQPFYSMNDATPVNYNFYQRYWSRLEVTYNVIKDYDYIDIVVPLETSILNTGSIDFVTQLGMYCQDFHDKSGMIQIGVIGSRSNGISEEDIKTLEDKNIFKNKYTMFDSQNQIIGDMGRFIVPVYGELIINHNFLNRTYVSSGAATVAGMISSNPVNQSLIRKRMPSVFGLSGISLNQSQVDRLDNIGVNTFTRNSKTRRGNTYQIYLTNDNTMANSASNYRKLPQIRLCAMLINEIRALSNNNISKFSSQKAVEDVRQLLSFLKSNNIISDYTFDAYSDQEIMGKLYFDISVISSLGLKKLSFSISSGKAA